jgi:hypothetical protein
MAAAAATDVVGLVDDLDVIQALDLVDMLADDDREFRGGGACYYSAIFSDADTVSHCRRVVCEDGDGDSGAAAACAWLLAGLDDDKDCGDGAEEEEEEQAGLSPASSGVTDDGALAMAAGDDADAEAISAYMAELERFLLEDDDDDEQAEVDQGLLGVVYDYFAGDQLLATAEVVSATGSTEATDGEEEENSDDVLAAREDEQSASRKRARYE